MPDILLELKNIKRVLLPGKMFWMISVLLLPEENLSLFLVHPDAVRLLRCVLLLVWNRQTVEVYGSMVRM